MATIERLGILVAYNFFLTSTASGRISANKHEKYLALTKTENLVHSIQVILVNLSDK